MDEQQKTLANISALLDFGVDAKTMKPWFSFASLTSLLTIRINGLVYMTLSRALEDRFSDDSEVMEVKCVIRRPSKCDLAGYAWRYESLQEMPSLTVICIEGDLCMKIICDSYDIESEPLGKRFPLMR